MKAILVLLTLLWFAQLSFAQTEATISDNGDSALIRVTNNNGILFFCFPETTTDRETAKTCSNNSLSSASMDVSLIIATISILIGLVAAIRGLYLKRKDKFFMIMLAVNIVIILLLLTVIFFPSAFFSIFF